MELRSATHLHFIQGIKGGLVAKLMNVDTRGRPKLKVKEIREIYNFGDDIYDNQVPRIHLRDDLESSPTKTYAVKEEYPDSPLVRGIKIKSEPEVFDFNCDGGERDSDLDDLSFANMTLKQIKKRCKTKKRKRLNSDGSSKETVEACSSAQHDSPNFQHSDDEFELEEPLISWKSKMSKNKKSKRKLLRKNTSASSPNPMCVIKSEKVHSDEDVLQPDADWPAPVGIKVEVSEPSYSECQSISTVTSVSTLGCSEQADSFVTVSNEVAETAHAHTLETEVPYPSKEPNHCSLNTVSYEYVENFEPQFDAEVSGWEIIKVDTPEILAYEYSDLSEFKKEDYIVNPLPYDDYSELMSPTKNYSCDLHDASQSNYSKDEMPCQTCSYSLIQVPETTFACGEEAGVSLYPIEEPVCSISNGVSYGYMEDVDPNFGERSSGWEIVKVDSPEIISYRCSESEEFGTEGTVYLLPYHVSPESMSQPEDHSHGLHDSFKSNSSAPEMAWQTSNYGQTEVPEMDCDNDLQCSENMSEVSACSFESRTASDNSSFWSSSCLNREKRPVPVSGGSPLAEKQSFSPASRVIYSFAASDEPTASPGPRDYCQMKEQHGPERLLSTRKAISPASQERLCRAMELTGLEDNGHHRCRGKLFFGKQTNHRILRAQGLEQVKRDGASVSPKSIMKRARHVKKGSPPKGILKVTNSSRSIPGLSAASSTVQRCSQNAIAFSQRQMQDIESLATKLRTELKSMKDIMKGQLHSEASPAMAAKENADEMRTAIENATKVEETAKRWLAMMARDCNRFCKIMKLTEENTAASERVIPKERKIIFADEAGGKLCHVKVFKDDMNTAPLQECGSEKQRLPVE